MPLIGIAAAETPDERGQRTRRCWLNLNGGFADLANRSASLHRCLVQRLHFACRPRPESGSPRIITAPQLPGSPTHGTIGRKPVVPAEHPVESKAQWPAVVRATDSAAVPKLFDDLICLLS